MMAGEIERDLVVLVEHVRVGRVVTHAANHPTDTPLRCLFVDGQSFGHLRNQVASS